MKASITAKVCTAIFAATLAGSAFGDHIISIDGINYGGSGCPQGSVGKEISSDEQAFTLIFDQYIAEVGPGVPLSAGRKNCQIGIKLNVPAGWTYMIADFDYRGYVSLDRGVDAKQTSRYYFQGDSITGNLSTRWDGPIDENYFISDSVDQDVWAPCGARRSLNVNTAIQVSTRDRHASGKMGLITIDSIDGVFHTYKLKFKRC
ncbi:MAG: DUF4360 domain-containing protein [Oligoflexales bacterium]